MELKIDSPDEDTAARLLKAFPGYYDGFVKCQPGNLMLPVLFGKNAQTYVDFKTRPDDTFVLSFPKSGKQHDILDRKQMRTHEIQKYRNNMDSRNGVADFKRL